MKSPEDDKAWNGFKHTFKDLFELENNSPISDSELNTNMDTNNKDLSFCEYMFWAEYDLVVDQIDRQIDEPISLYLTAAENLKRLVSFDPNFIEWVHFFVIRAAFESDDPEILDNMELVIKALQTEREQIQRLIGKSPD